MILRVDAETCCRCGVCGMVFPGMPELAFGGIAVPAWAEGCVMAARDELCGQCPAEAITIEEHDANG